MNEISPSLAQTDGRHAAPRIVHLTTVHPVFDVRIFLKECRTLANAGYHTLLVAPHQRDEEKEGVTICALPPPGNRWRRMLSSTWRAYRAAVAARACVVHFHDPELIPAGILLKLTRNTKVVYDVHEDVPRQIMSKEWLPKTVRPIASLIAHAVESVGSFSFDGFVAATPSIARRFPRKRTVVVQNFPRVEEMMLAEIPYAERPPVVSYIGAVTEYRGIRQMMKAMSLLPNDPKEKRACRLTIAGTFGPASLEDEVKKMKGAERLDLKGWISREEVVDLLRHSRIGLAVLLPRPNHVEGYPIKLFEYMACGVPVIASNFPLWKSIVEGAKCGLVVDPTSPEAIASAIQWLLEHPAQAEEMGKNGRSAVLNRFNWEKEELKLLAFYRDRLGANLDA